MDTVGDLLPKEQARVRELLVMYRDPMLGGSGLFAAALMEASLKAADEALLSGDLTKIIASYVDLKEYSA
jgi:hypothetical protein